MTHPELIDNLSYYSALQMLYSLSTAEILTDAEAENVREELKRRLRPSV